MPTETISSTAGSGPASTPGSRITWNSPSCVGGFVGSSAAASPAWPAVCAPSGAAPGDLGLSFVLGSVLVAVLPLVVSVVFSSPVGPGRVMPFLARAAAKMSTTASIWRAPKSRSSGRARSTPSASIAAPGRGAAKAARTALMKAPCLHLDFEPAAPGSVERSRHVQVAPLVRALGCLGIEGFHDAVGDRLEAVHVHTAGVENQHSVHQQHLPDRCWWGGEAAADAAQT